MTPILPSKPLVFSSAVIAVLIATATHGQEPRQLSQAISFGAYYSNGSYGEEIDTEIRYFPISYEANYGKWGFQLLLPYLEYTGLGNALINIGGVTRAVAGTQATMAGGLGDAVVSLSYQIDPVTTAAPFIDLRLNVKIPTADENKSLGTGEADYSLQIDLSQYLADSVVFATVGYNFRGKSDLFQGLQDSAFAQVGMAHPVNERWNIGIFYDFREAASSFTAETHDIVPYFSWQLDANWTFTGLASWGFTDASADITILGQMSYRW